MTDNQRPAVSYKRFSRIKQAGGDSRRRQEDVAKKYCAANNLKLIDVFFDQGVSGFKGHHRRKGKLGDLIEAARRKKFPVGTAIIVESLDRLSREEVPDALQLFLELINTHRLEIHAVADDPPRVYKRQGLNLENLIISIVVMSRAHGESKRKSDLVAASWKGLRLRGRATSRPDKKPMGRHPSWLEWHNGSWVVIEERAEVICYMFHELVLKRRLGRYEIARTLVEEKRHYWSTKGTGWTASGVKRFITNPALVGDLVPAKSSDPEAVVVPNYYPTIIPPDLYAQVQRLIEARKSGGGRPRQQHSLALLTGFSFVSGKRLHRGFSKQPSGSHQLNYSYVDDSNRNRYFASGAILENVVVRGLMLLSFGQVTSSSGGVEVGLRARRAELFEQCQAKEAVIKNYVVAIGVAGEELIELIRAMTVFREERNLLMREIDSIDSQLAMIGGQGSEESWLRLNELLDAALVEKNEQARCEVRSILQSLIKRVDLGRRDQENWWIHFPKWSYPGLEFMNSLSFDDPENNVGYIDDEEPGTPRPPKPEDKPVAAVEFWSGTKVLLRNGIVFPC